MIDLHSYWLDRDTKYRLECTGAIRDNALKTVAATRKLLTLAEAETGLVWDTVTSGWRPKSVNDATANAAKGSNHLLALAVDIGDPDRTLAQWCVSNPDKLAECGIWIEDPRFTATWLHAQIVQPKSGKRIYIPSTKPPTAPALIGQKPIPVGLKL